MNRRTNHVIAASILLLGLAHGAVYAQPCDPNVTSGCPPTGGVSDPDANISNPDGSTSNTSGTSAAATTDAPKPIVLDNPLGVTDVRQFIARFIDMMTGISGSLALAAFVYGGFEMLTAAGDGKKVESGKNTLKYATIGLIMIFGAYVAVRAVYALIGV